MLPAKGSASTRAIVACSTCPITAILGELLTMFVMINQSCESPPGEGSSSKYRIPSADYARTARFSHREASALLRLKAERPQEHANEIGRASCRERGERWVGGGGVVKK